MPVQTRINVEFLTDYAYYPLRLSLYQLGERAGLSENYIYQLVNAGRSINVQVSTLDALHNAIEARLIELGLPVPDDLWQRLTVQEIKSE